MNLRKAIPLLFVIFLSFTTNITYADDQILGDLYKKQLSDVQVQGSGTVIRLLPDDNKGSRHQRFVVELGSGQTLLVAHNIDLAPRVMNPSEGDFIEFYGEYEWNSKGGVIHWTHLDPKRRHLHGWLKHNGTKYQ